MSKPLAVPTGLLNGYIKAEKADYDDRSRKGERIVRRTIDPNPAKINLGALDVLFKC